MPSAFGIDIGGSGIKGAPVDLETGELAAERLRIPTPEKSTPDAVAEVCAQIVREFGITEETPIGIAFPAPIRHGVVAFIANLHQSWKGVNFTEVMSKHIGRPVTAVNDADAAGYAEVYYGAAKGVEGTVIVTTLGTGIGSAIVVDGHLLPNTELGHLEIDGYDAEKRAAASVRTAEDLSFEKWGKRLTRYYGHVNMLFSPDLFVIGGGVSKNFDKFIGYIDVDAAFVPAQLRNQAGIVGAARLAADGHH
ncbi:polyphosphate glucokinase [Ruaniaceae bacterium KH17]|nr:polyphosphate glucokinase [Ruaniaceae bacterium KH17]